MGEPLVPGRRRRRDEPLPRRGVRAQRVPHPPLQREFGWTRSQLSAAFTILIDTTAGFFGMRQMTRNPRLPATSLFLAVVLSITGSIPLDAAAGILPVPVPSPADSRLVAPASGVAGDGEPCADRGTHASWRSRAILLLLIIVIIVVLVYRYFTGWKPMISGSPFTFPFVA